MDQIENTVAQSPVIIKERKNWIDWMKTFGMLAIIWGHCFPTLFSSFLYAFSVGSFFVLSGYLVKHENSQRVFWVKLFRTLFVPYVFFAVLKAAQTIFSEDGFTSLMAITTGFHSLGNVTGCGKLWFVYTLMILKIVFQYCATSTSRRICIVVVSIAGAVAYCHFTDEVAWAVGNALISMPFFLLGNQLKNSNSFGRIETKLSSLVWWKSGILVLVSALLTYSVSYFNGPAWMYMGEYGANFILFCVAGLLGIFFLFALSCSLNRIKFVGCQVISVGSVAILAYHQDINHPMLKWIQQQNWTTLQTDLSMLLASIITLLAFIPIIHILSRYLPFAIGYRKV